ncbi:hypothetical protein CYY_004411 [Polysphondylium violaceum]|uniref:RED-like N-terminal domain-containing protein n=1 Tax=Polysphondylium violaceum TaxID=133409 RepID=A0A8J4V0C9_9MYCE|nr:hypothetical protein CYY_004411 [Polysphondylium violaceum]
MSTLKQDSSSSSNNNNDRNSKKKKKWVERDYNYYKNAPDKIDDPNYRDRAKERRNQNEDDEGQSTKSSGLDFNLLKRDDSHLNSSNTSSSSSGGNKETKKTITCKSVLGNSIYNVLLSSATNSNQQQQQHQKNKELFQKGRMIYVYELDPNFPSLIPTTILNSKEDCPPIKHVISGKLDTSILKKVIESYNPDKTVNIIKEKNNSDDSHNENNSPSNNNNNNNSLNILLPTNNDDDDSGSDIFSDAEEYVCDVVSKVNKQMPIDDNEEADKKFDYFSKSNTGVDSKEDEMMKEFNPIGKEGDEKEDGEDGEIEGPSMPPHDDQDDEIEGPSMPPQDDQDDEIEGPSMPQDNASDQDEDQDIGPSIPQHMYINNNEDQEDEEAYPDTDMNYERPNNEEEEQEENSQDEYEYPNTEDNFNQHEEKQKIEMEKRYQDNSDSDSDDLPIIDTNNESLKRKLLEQQDSYGDVIPSYQGFDRERGEKPQHTIDEMYKFKKEPKKKRSKTIDGEMHKVNSMLKKNYGDKYDLFNQK